MVTRVVGAPDSNGIIRIACGSDVIEVEVVSAKPEGSTAGNPLDTPHTWLATQLSLNPNDTPTSWIVEPSGPSKKLDIDALVARIKDQNDDPNRPNPLAVIIEGPTVNIHDMARLSDRIAKEAPGLAMAFKSKGRLP